MRYFADMDVPALYVRLALSIGDGTGLSDSLLHVHAGMLILILAHIVARRGLRSPIPILMVAAFEAANEILDRLHYGSWRWADTGLDIFNTMFWPTVIFVTLRLSIREAKPELADHAPSRCSDHIHPLISKP